MSGQVPEGYAVYAADGTVGAVRNEGDLPLVILALLIVPESGTAAGEDWAVATPAP